MFNCKRIYSTAWGYSEEKQGFMYKALEDIPKECALYTTYGEKDNLSFFLHYGVLSPNIEKNVIRLVFNLNPQDPLYSTKMELMNGLYTQYITCAQTMNSPVMNEMLSWCRFIAYEGDPRPLQKGKNAATNAVFQARQLEFFNVDNEAKAWQLIMSTAQLAYNRYPNSLQEDLELLEHDKRGSKPLSTNYKNIIVFRKAEKEILVFLIETAKMMRKMLGVAQNSNLIIIDHEFLGFKYYQEVETYVKGIIRPLAKDYKVDKDQKFMGQYDSIFKSVSSPRAKSQYKDVPGLQSESASAKMGASPAPHKGAEDASSLTIAVEAEEKDHEMTEPKEEPKGEEQAKQA